LEAGDERRAESARGWLSELPPAGDPREAAQGVP
jgi:hypothetical protein